MKVQIMSRAEIEELIKHDALFGVDVISFQDTNDMKKIDFRGLPHRVFSVALDDLEYDELESEGYTYDTFFPEADELAQFIREAITSDREIICQCEYGQGRSAGCAAAILEAVHNNGIKIFSDYRYFPNKVIYHKLVEKIW